MTVNRAAGNEEHSQSRADPVCPGCCQRARSGGEGCRGGSYGVDLVGLSLSCSGSKLGEICCATDLNARHAALLIELLAAHTQHLLYIPRTDRASRCSDLSGDGKADAKDARIIADQARMGTDLQSVRSAAQTSVDLRMITSRRPDLIWDRVRAINSAPGHLVWNNSPS